MTTTWSTGPDTRDDLIPRHRRRPPRHPGRLRRLLGRCRGRHARTAVPAWN